MNKKINDKNMEIRGRLTAAMALYVATLAGLYGQENSGVGKPGEVPGNEARVDWRENESLFLLPARDKYIPESGFTPFISWTGEFWSDVTRGDDISTLFDSLFTLGFEQDISTVLGGENLGRIGVSAFYYTQTGDGSLGNFSSTQGCFSNIVAGEMLRVFEIYYANEFETGLGNIGFRIGQLAADEDFMGMDYSDVFLNSSLGAIPNVAPGALFSQYNVATLGLVLYYALDNVDAAFGLYNGNVGQDIPSNNGFDYSNTFETLAFWYQFGYNYSLGDLKGRAIFGGNYHSNPSKVNFDRGLGANFYSFYFGVQQDILNNCEGDAVLGAFARVGYVPSSECSDNNFYADFGFNWFSPIPGRGDDVFAVAVSVIENERQAREEYSHYEATVEVTYRCQLTPAVAVQPNFQVFLNPKTSYDATVYDGPVYIVGARVDINF